MPRLAIDDSYKEAPVACLEDSKGGLNRRLAGSAGLDEHPQDFTFLLNSANAGNSDAQPLAEDAVSSRATWQPNANAPEFIPTLSMQCPLMAMVVPGTQTPSRGVAHLQAGSMGDRITDVNNHTLKSQIVEPNSTPEKGREPSPAGGRRRGGGKRRRPSAVQAIVRKEGPAQKRTKSEDREESRNARMDSIALATPVSMPNQEATEEDWQRRAEMRQKAIVIVKISPSTDGIRRRGATRMHLRHIRLPILRLQIRWTEGSASAGGST